MKWKLPRDRETRTFKKFLWLPKEAGGEVRWLCVAKFEAEYSALYGSWLPARWLNA